MLTKKFSTFFSRNILRIETYRLKSFFNISNNKFDHFFYKSKKSRFIFKAIHRFISVIRYYFNLKIDIHSIDFNLTTSCNMRCKDCASLMPYYDNEHQWTINLQTFKSDLDKLLSRVNKIYRLKLIGGEPLIVKDLEKMLAYACSKKKVNSVIITTNCKMIFPDGLCEILSKYKKKALVELSDYSSVVDNLKLKEIKEKLERYSVYYFISNYKWFEPGKIYRRTKTKQELIQTYDNCFQQPCLSFFDGKIYNCTRAAAINRLTKFKFEAGSIINIRNDKVTNKDLKNFYSKDYYEVCCFCPLYSEQVMSRGIQTYENFKIPEVD